MAKRRKLCFAGIVFQRVFAAFHEIFVVFLGRNPHSSGVFRNPVPNDQPLNPRFQRRSNRYVPDRPIPQTAFQQCDSVYCCDFSAPQSKIQQPAVNFRKHILMGNPIQVRQRPSILKYNIPQRLSIEPTAFIRRAKTRCKLQSHGLAGFGQFVIDLICVQNQRAHIGKRPQSGSFPAAAAAGNSNQGQIFPQCGKDFRFGQSALSENPIRRPAQVEYRRAFPFFTDAAIQNSVNLSPEIRLHLTGRNRWNRSAGIRRGRRNRSAKTPQQFPRQRVIGTT